MKRIVLIAVALVAGFMAANAQKFALVDMEYILKNIPAYEMANEQLNQVSQRWQREVDELKKEADTMYKNYQSDMVFLTDDQKKKKEAEITEKEKEAQQLQYKYFGMDRASSQSIIFASPRIDVSNEVLEKMGYK